MENSFQTSFIPKKPIVSNGASSLGPRSTTSITMVVTVFIFVVMVLSTGGLYFYKGYLEQSKEKLSTDLSKIRDSFNKDTIAELEIYDKRASVAKQVLEGHVVLSPLFELINELTLSSIQYTRFEHKTDGRGFSVMMSGIANDYRSIALQADVLNTSKGKMLKDVVFSDLTKDKNNYVTFNVEFTVDPALLSYSNSISNGASFKENSDPLPNPSNEKTVGENLEVDSGLPLQETTNTQ